MALSKIIKIPLKILAVLLGLMIILLIVFQTSWFKNYAAQKATSYLSKELEVDVSIGDISLSYFDRLDAKDVYIADQNSDTMIYVHELEVNYDLFSFTSEAIQFDDILIDQAVVNIGIPKDSTNLNIRYLIKYLSPPSTSTTKSKGQTITFDKIEIKNTSFNYFNKNFSPPTDRAFDENDMAFTNLYGHLHNFQIIKDSLSFVLDDISGKEKSGLQIDDLGAETIISSTTMRFDKLRIITPKSDIKDYLEFNYKSYADFSDFIEVVKVKSNFNESHLHTDDLALFSNTLSDYNELITASGKVDGTIANLRSRNLDLKVGNHTSFIGSARLTGLPDIYKTKFDIDAKQLTTQTKDLARLIKLDPTPKEFLNLGRVSYVGTFKGFIDDFKLDASITSDVGNIRTDLQFNQKQTIATYTGNVQSENLNLQKLLEDPKLGSTSFDLNIDGRGLALKQLSAGLTGQVNHIDYDGYDYKNIGIDGNVKDKIFAGNFKINDPNFTLDFDGNLDVTADQPKVAIATNVTTLNLKTLGLDTIDNILSFNGDLKLIGDNIDNITGDIDLDSLTLARNNSTYKIKNVKFNATDSNNQKHYSLYSNILNADVKGEFLPSEINTLIAYVEHIISPKQFSNPDTKITSKDFTISVDIDTFQPLFKEFIGDAYFDSAYVNFGYNHDLGKINGIANFQDLKYDIVSSPKVEVSIKNGGNLTPVNFAINTQGLLQNDSTIFNRLNANGYIKDGIINFETTAIRDTILDIALGGRFIYQNDSAMVYVDNSKLIIYDESWDLRKTNTPNLIVQNGITELRSFDFRNGNQILYLEASSGYLADKVNVNLTDFKLENLTPFIAGFNLKLQGLTNGYIDVSDREGFPIIEADLVVDDLKLDDDLLADTLILKSVNKDGLLAVALDGKIVGGLLNDMSILGDIDFKDKISPLNLNLSTVHSNIKPFEKYLVGLASNISGFSTTDIKITGPLNRPKLNGTMAIDSLDFVVDYLRTNYKGQANIDIDYNSFTLTNANLYDRFGQKGIVKGEVSHTNFQDFRFNIDISDLNNFEIMNTGREDNELFYGTAFVDGSMKVLGPMDDILLQINAKSRKGTEIKIPLDNSEASGKLSYVEFVNLKVDNNNLNNPLKSTAGVRMDFNFEITNDANITLIFDELLGDKIEAAGHGNLRMEINTYGDFNMYGGLTIDRGSYLFTALDLITKYFTVKQGGTLFWDGNPYNAKINLEAIKREYPVPLQLVKGTVPVSEEYLYETAIPADCYLKLTGLLFNPEVSFDLSFPSQTALSGNASSSLKTVIERVKLDKEELNRQVFALLVLGTFVPPSFASGSVENALANTGINSLSDFASSQLNNWLGQLDTRFQLGVDYQTSYESSAELIVSLKRKFLNDKLEVSGSVDAAAQGSKPYDISVEYNIGDDGNSKIRGFQKLANDPTLGNINNVTTTGVGFFYRFQFDKFRLRKKKIKPKKKE